MTLDSYLNEMIEEDLICDLNIENKNFVKRVKIK